MNRFSSVRWLVALPGLDVARHDQGPFGMTPSAFPPGEVVPEILGGKGGCTAAESGWAVRRTRLMNYFLLDRELAALPGLNGDHE